MIKVHYIRRICLSAIGTRYRLLFFKIYSDFFPIIIMIDFFINRLTDSANTIETIR